MVPALVGVLLWAVVLGQRVIGAVPARLDESDIRRHLVVVVAAAVGGSALTCAVGIEPALGASVIGLLFARAGGVPERARATFERMTLGVFAPVFFGVAGLNADLGSLFDPVVAVVDTTTLVIATVGEIGGVYLAAPWLGFDRAEALGMGFGLNARDVTATVGLELGIPNSRTYAVVFVVAVVTSAMTPPLLRRVLGGISSDPDPGRDVARSRRP